MRIAALTLAALLVAQPAWAHHKLNHPDHPRTTAPVSFSISRDPCAVSNSPHENPALQAMGQRCRTLRAELSRNPDDAELRARCDRAARALTGRRCAQFEGR